MNIYTKIETGKLEFTEYCLLDILSSKQSNKKSLLYKHSFNAIKKIAKKNLIDIEFTSNLEFDSIIETYSIIEHYKKFAFNYSKVIN